jgi:very-short-patch-repair endonuclease
VGSKATPDAIFAALANEIDASFVQEHRFSERKWRFDFAWPAKALAVELEGGSWVRGRHNRPQGFENDCEKYNAAALLGWRVLRFTTGMVISDLKYVQDTLRAALG